MQPKKILYAQEARQKILKGAEKLAKAVRTTMGSNGRNVLIRGRLDHIVTKDGKSVLSRKNTVTKDGATVAKDVVLEDPFEDIGAQLVNEAANKTNEESADGTTTSTVLAYAIMNEGFDKIKKGANAIALKRGITKAVVEVCKVFKEIARPVSEDELWAIATLSSQDEEIGRMVSDVMIQVGEGGIVDVQGQVEPGISSEYAEGMIVDNGYIVPNFITNPDDSTCVLENAFVLMTDQKIKTKDQILPIMEKIKKKHGRCKLAIFCETMDGDALLFYATNTVKGVIDGVVVRTPLMDDYRIDILEDIAAITGGRALVYEYSGKVENAKLEDLGFAKKIIVSKDTTTIVDGAGEKKRIEDRISIIKNNIEKADKDFDEELMQKRVARMSGGVAVIKVGARSEAERLERHHRVEDAIGATRSAWSEGVIPGSGRVYLTALEHIKNLSSPNKDEQLGIDIVKNALSYPAAQILENCGEKISLLKSIKNAPEHYGYNGNTGKIEDLYEAHVIDPKKVVRVALENAASVASMFLTLECVMAEVEEDPDEVPYARNAKDAFRKMKK